MITGDTKTSDRLERALHASLRPIDPGAEFTAAVVERLARGAVAAPAVVSAAPHRLHRASLALAASVVMALAVSWQLVDVHSAQRAAQARFHTQLALALEITSERLGTAQQRIEQYQSQEKNL